RLGRQPWIVSRGSTAFKRKPANQRTSTQAHSPNPLRRFGLIVGAAFLILASIAWWRDAAARPYLAGGGGILVLLVLVLPRALRPVEFLWMKLALVLSYVMTRVIITLTFYLAISPTSLILRLLRKDLLSLKID